MTLEQYLQRDASLDAMEHAANGNLTTWVLAPRNDSKTLDFKCSCETYLRKGCVVQASWTEAVEVPCYTIASVFTPATKRGRGYAKHMMRLLHWVMAPHSSLPRFPEKWGMPPDSMGNAMYSVLYSGIGDFYSSCGPRDESGEGWTIEYAVETSWDVGKVRLESVQEDIGEWKWLDIPGAEELFKDETKLVKQDVIQSAKSTGRTSFAFLPGTMAGALIYYVLFSPLLPHINKWGVVLKDSSLSAKDNLRTFATWSVDKGPTSSMLITTCLRATQVTFPHLLRRLLEVAAQYDIPTVVVCNLPVELVEVAGQLGGKTEKSFQNLPGFKWYGDEKSEEVDWLFNKKFSWC